MAAIETIELRKRFGDDILALDGVNLQVKEGEIFGFLGPNGAGKSTTINVLLDFVRPTSGSATVLGMDAQEESQEIRRRTGVLPEGYQVYGRLTGRQHVQFVIDSKEVDDDPDALLERVGIPEATNRKAGGYSKGMKQRLTLAMALVGEPELLVLDEPSTGLDPAGAREIREIVREEAKRGATIFFSSHIMEQVEAVCDRVGILRAGELVAVDSIDGLREAAGDGATMRVELAELTDDAIAVVERVSGVTEVRRRDGGLTVSVGNGSKTRVLSALEDAGHEVTDFRTEETSLEEIFMSYTEGSR